MPWPDGSRPAFRDAAAFPLRGTLHVLAWHSATPQRNMFARRPRCGGGTSRSAPRDAAAASRAAYLRHAAERISPGLSPTQQPSHHAAARTRKAFAQRSSLPITRQHAHARPSRNARGRTSLARAELNFATAPARPLARCPHLDRFPTLLSRQLRNSRPLVVAFTTICMSLRRKHVHAHSEWLETSTSPNSSPRTTACERHVAW